MATPTVIRFTTHVRAPPERCFDLSRSIDLHVASTEGTDERAIAGRTRGLIELGETVTWSARHLGVRWRMTVKITRYDRPRSFTDEMVKGPFAWFRHTHTFAPRDGGTDMHDEFAFAAPLGVLGRMVSALVLERHMRHFLMQRAEHIKRVAEGEEWRRYLAQAAAGSASP